MRLKLFRMRFRRTFKRQRRQVEGLGQQAEEQIDKHVFKRIGKFSQVRRFVLGWTGLMAAIIAAVLLQMFNLSGYYQTVRAVDGGIYREGILGTFTTANPLYATNQVDASVAQLLFAGLFAYGADNTLVGDLAERYEMDARGINYTVHLKPGLTWHDGKPLTSADVVYTYQAIQNPDAQSPLRGSWQGITVAATDPLTVTFRLPSPLASFPNNLTNGIVPAHILGKVVPVDLRTSDFNTIRPVGAGPFRWQTIEVEAANPRNAQEQIALLPFTRYHAGTPKVDQFVVTAYSNQEQLVRDFATGQLTALTGLPNAPAELKDKEGVEVHNLMLTAGTYAFFKTTTPALSSQKVRQALVQSTDQAGIIAQLEYPTRVVRSPLLKEQLAYDPSLLQLPPDLAAAKAMLDADGWKPNAKGIRAKGDMQLRFNLVAADTPEYKAVTDALARQWKRVGVHIDTRLLGPQDFQNALAYHDYDIVVYGISLGTDPDVFVYWNSKQADIRSGNRLNLSEYKSAVADEALESGRTRQDPQLRTVKYKAFLQAWQQDAPAVGLYQPRTLYLTNGDVYGLTEDMINTGTDRFRNVHNWQIRQGKVTN